MRDTAAATFEGEFSDVTRSYAGKAWCDTRGNHATRDASGFDHVAWRSVIRVSSDGRPRRSAKPGHSPVPLFT